MSFFVAQWMSNVAVTGCAMYTCPQSYTGLASLDLIYNVPFLGGSIVGTNFLCHRYLLEKANVMSTQISYDSEWSRTKTKVENYLKWEMRTLILLFISFLLFFIHTMTNNEKNETYEDKYTGVELAAHIVLSTQIVVVMILDLFVSIFLTVVFLRPLLELLDRGRSASNSEAYIQIRRTKIFTLCGALLAVTSSSLLYINLLVWYLWGYVHDPDNAYLNPLLFGANVDSIVNDVSMLLACGAFKDPAEWCPQLTCGYFMSSTRMKSNGPKHSPHTTSEIPSA